MEQIQLQIRLVCLTSKVVEVRLKLGGLRTSEVLLDLGLHLAIDFVNLLKECLVYRFCQLESLFVAQVSNVVKERRSL